MTRSGRTAAGAHDLRTDFGPFGSGLVARRMLTFKPMRRRTRWIAGLFALLAMTFSLAETVWASMCAPMMDMQVSAAAAEAAPSEHEGMPGMPDQPGPASGDGTDCPFSPATTAQNCSAAASLPAHTIGGPASTLERVVGLKGATARQDLLLETALFHPPRA